MNTITDNEVAEVAKMQKRIDDLEKCFENLFLCLREKRPRLQIMPYDRVLGYEEVWNFMRFVMERHPEILKEIERAER